jgi:hypothetical protein
MNDIARQRVDGGDRKNQAHRATHLEPDVASQPDRRFRAPGTAEGAHCGVETKPTRELGAQERQEDHGIIDEHWISRTQPRTDHARPFGLVDHPSERKQAGDVDRPYPDETTAPDERGASTSPGQGERDQAADCERQSRDRENASDYLEDPRPQLHTRERQRHGATCRVEAEGQKECEQERYRHM